MKLYRGWSGGYAAGRVVPKPAPAPAAPEYIGGDRIVLVDLDAALGISPDEAAKLDAQAAAEAARLAAYKYRLARARESQARGDALVASVAEFEDSEALRAQIQRERDMLRWGNPNGFDMSGALCR